MASAPTESNTTSTRPANRNLVNACKQFYDQWLPVNEGTLSQIKDGLSTGAYDLDQHFFFETLKTDIGLFTYFLRQARRKIQARDKSKESVKLTPRQLFSTLTAEERISIFDIKAQEISPHLLKNASKLQSLQLRELVVGASATEALSHHNSIDGISGFSVSTLQMIGRSMIAWNMPELFEEAIHKTPNSKHLDDTLTGMLGFSPQLLVIALARDWGLSSDIRAALGDKQAITSDLSNSVTEVSSMLEKLYEVGATIARAHTPELYPTADEDWKSAKQSVSEIVGPDGMKIIQKQVKENCYHYLKAAPEIFQPSTRPEPSAPKPRTSEGLPQNFRENKYIRVCPPEAQAVLKELYVEMNLGKLNKVDGIRRLITEAAPIVGFPRGCIFLLEPETMRLTPRLSIGPRSQHTYEPTHAFSVSTRSINPVGAAYHCNTPIIQSDFSLTNIGELCFASVLGKKQRVGILYLEPEEELTIDPNSQLLQRFKAIVVGFEHLLGIS